MASIAKPPKQYIAVRGIDFDALGIRVEPGDPIPAKVTEGVIKMLLANGDIEEVKEKEKE